MSIGYVQSGGVKYVGKRSMMIKISDQELASLARTSRLMISDNTQERIVHKLDAVLSYAQILAVAANRHAAGVTDIDTRVHENVTRLDRVIVTDREKILALAPRQEEGYFVVPVVVVEQKRGN
jgi:aspartyl/glutamyl-tRNA(Asn/Gln) amidotransferase C subunit